MHFLALASDYDGTLATDGNVTDATWGAVQRLRVSGRKLILVTGRSFNNLVPVVPRLEAFDGIVAENGAVLYCPAEHRTVRLSRSLPNRLVERLQHRNVEPLWMGEIVLATRIENAQEINEAVRHLELDLGIVTNNNTIMVLPPGVDKATGLVAALDELAITADRVVSIGDGENDVALFESSGCGVAVANASAMVKKAADLITKATAGAGVSELIDRLIATDLAEVWHCVDSRRTHIDRMAA
jgi:hydroxymethylpyrimidine pyrophosphatase-like HAD family hydrolase